MVTAAVLVLAGLAAAQTRQPPINVVFNVHLDPAGPPDPQMHKAELERRRDNVLWLKSWIESIDKAKRPRLNVQISGDHAEFYLQDEKGLAMLAELYKQGHELGTHMHRNIYNGEFLSWSELRPSRPFQKPAIGPGDVITPGVLAEPNSMDEVRRLWNDNFRFSNELLAKVTGVTDPAGLRAINNNGEFHLPNSWEGKDVLFKQFGITVETGGRNEVFNMIFDHDVFHPWRPSMTHELAEDLSNKAYICVPQLAVVGNIKMHFGQDQDLSLAAMKRRFLHAFLERREQERLGLPPKVWTFGWTMHGFDLYPEGAARRVSQRKNVQELVEWINASFVPAAARWATPNDVAREFYAWEKQHPGVSSFHYPHRKQNWDAYPFRLKGLAKALISAHYVRAISDWRGQGVEVHEFERVKPGSAWYTDDANAVRVRGETTKLYIVWAGKPAKVDLSKLAGLKVTVIRGGGGQGRSVDANTVAVDAEPLVVEGN